MDNAYYSPMQPQPPVWPPVGPQAPFFPTGKREFAFGFVMLILGWLLCNSIFYGGFNLGFAIFACLAVVCTVIYLLQKGCKLSLYSILLLVCALIIAASFARSDDSFVKFILFCFLLLSVNLGLCLLAGQNRRDPKGFLSLLDVPRTVFVLGLGQMGCSFRGLRYGFRQSGAAGKKGGAVFLGLLIAVPLLAILLPLLINADAAFEALLKKLPDWDFTELVISVLFGSLLACYLYIRGTALHHTPKVFVAPKVRKGVNPLTVNTALCCVALVYAVYLVSQLAYFSGGFSGILPKDFTMAEYARRGFFEMAWLCAINLGIIALAVGLVSGKGKAPLFTRLICLFLGIVTSFLVVSASAKMFMYIDAYGLTRLRVLTEVIMLWIGIATLTVSLWLFAPKLPYMKVVLIAALLIGAAVAWADVDTVVARYNVTAYQSGKLETIDMDHLDSLGNGAIPYIAQLKEDSDPDVAENAKNLLRFYYGEDYYRTEPCLIEDFRDWNYVDHKAESFILFLRNVW